MTLPSAALPPLASVDPDATAAPPTESMVDDRGAEDVVYALGSGQITKRGETSPLRAWDGCWRSAP